MSMSLFLLKWEGPHATWVRCPGAEARLDCIACDMRTAEQASWCGIEGRIDLAVSSIEDRRLVRANFEICPPQRVPSVQSERSPQPLDRKCMLRPDAREKFPALLSQRHNCLLNSSSVPERMISSICATLRNATDLSFPYVAKKRPRKHGIQDDTWLLIGQTQKQRAQHALCFLCLVSCVREWLFARVQRKEIQ